MSLTPPISAQDHHLGPLDVPLVVVHYGDFECPYSGALAPWLHQLKAERGDEMCLIFRSFPLSDLHPHAQNAAFAAEAAGDKFWPMHDLLFDNQRDLEEDDLLGYAAQLGLDCDNFVQTMNANETRARVEQSVESGHQSGAHGTPTVFINGEFYDNDQQLWKRPRLESAILAELSK